MLFASVYSINHCKKYLTATTIGDLSVSDFVVYLLKADNRLINIWMLKW